ncbi:matrixin family metalloprotease [Halogeometricum borinquense]|uniref:Matrixin family metalloprotease n=1 Tax=Halogeometricum borinquense TaxID=60847 RepID=A0A6C0UT67_9EURY|nr:matrixin family metalloprotease [Halogeometricum borinquense]QIB76138.1 matrixin family metalloprotease [Halogeometricum borinquense]QIQ75421.1 matrixin family metalloprotease [Halogeometricum borinquense]
MSARRSPAVALVLLLVLSGCLAPFSGAESPIPVDEETPSAPTSTEHAAARTATQNPTASATAAPTGASPWGDDPIVVAVSDPEHTGRDWTPLVRQAAAYWETNAEQYAGYTVEYEVRPNAANPDIVVEFVDGVPDCDGAEDAAGCAPLITDRRQIDSPETVSIQTGFSDDSTVLVLEHEFGHTLGLTHDDAPADVMASRSVLYTTPQPNATERAFPWDDGEFTVYVDSANATNPEQAREQVQHALDYYERGAEGMPNNLTFTVVDDAENADIVVGFSDESPCSPDAASCGATRGWDPDGDGVVETYSNLRIVLVDLDTDAVGWHTGYWLAFGFGAEDDAEKPDPFRDASYRERRSEWWE